MTKTKERAPVLVNRLKEIRGLSKVLKGEGRSFLGETVVVGEVFYLAARWLEVGQSKGSVARLIEKARESQDDFFEAWDKARGKKRIKRVAQDDLTRRDRIVEWVSLMEAKDKRELLELVNESLTGLSEDERGDFIARVERFLNSPRLGVESEVVIEWMIGWVVSLVPMGWMRVERSCCGCILSILGTS